MHLRWSPLMGSSYRMLENQEQEELITVRVQDPRVQNEGSWNSYVDYKIFLHTNSKAFTAKTSCVRRRYREFVWLRKQLQRNAGLVPVPELPGKSTFFSNSDEFIEKRRQGLQHFLEKVLQNVVLLSDSQLHLFLQSQLSIPEIEACVQGRSPMTVADAILHYAMSNCGWVQEENMSSPQLAMGDQRKRMKRRISWQCGLLWSILWLLTWKVPLFLFQPHLQTGTLCSLMKGPVPPSPGRE
ncbi:sorting nexin-11 isoform X3 [Antechinus flavipes]|uniref:sorting nexin-11 isoform X3 n=1 Tax=Antechinus flavipes TaxID=38775 RepID=UPI002235D3FE|nr:sorting nexin-11 isoform X3 [Antechinus flavipes]